MELRLVSFLLNEYVMLCYVMLYSVFITTTTTIIIIIIICINSVVAMFQQPHSGVCKVRTINGLYVLLPSRRYASCHRVFVCPFVCLIVCLSVTSRGCTKRLNVG